jgi:hypothetical protein
MKGTVADIRSRCEPGDQILVVGEHGSNVFEYYVGQLPIDGSVITYYRGTLEKQPSAEEDVLSLIKDATSKYERLWIVKMNKERIEYEEKILEFATKEMSVERTGIRIELWKRNF